ncbi:MAG: hypothetical protein HY561_07210 [Gemmatimonadetes bacterium]|nr:hypothetical protein [Gemmatimonadota bacterium]
MPLDFKRATDLFMGTDKELALALGMEPGELIMYRKAPGRVSSELLGKLGKVLVERGKGMMRVGEMLQEIARE